MVKATTSTRGSKVAAEKTAKPYPGFPLTAHPSGRWCKKHQGRQHYFGPVSDWKAALTRYEHEWPYIIAGRVPPPIEADGLRIRGLANQYLTHKRGLLTNGELSERSFRDYLRTCEAIVEAFGRERLVSDLRAEDFARLRVSLSDTRNANSLGNEINRIRGVFKYAFDAALIETPIRFGPGFARPSKKTLRIERQQKQQEHGKRMLEAADLRAILKAASQPLKAMILLGANCGLGQSDLSNLPKSALNLETGWLDYPRPKTGVERRCPLWPETVEALQQAIAIRPKPKDPADEKLIFVTKYGLRWVKATAKSNDDAIAKEFAKLLVKLDLKRPGVNFYALRHGFQTAAGGSRDPEAVSHVMGHADASMAGLYREGISDDRLKAVCEHVRNWLWPDAATKLEGGE